MKQGLPERLRERLDAENLQNPEFVQTLTDESVRRARVFVAGLRAYQHHPVRRDFVEAPVVWQEGTTRLLDYNVHSPDLPIVLVIPSLINRFAILDLDETHSFVRTLALRGFRPLVVDWDVPSEAEQDFSIGDYVTQRLIPILDSLGPKPVHVLGYCMGGLLALALAVLKPLRVKTLTLLATPWDFHQPDASLAQPFLTLVEQMEPVLKIQGSLPIDMIQGLFAAFQPLQTLTKFTSFAGLDKASEEARHFVLIEDWLNDGVPLTANAARECLRAWYGENVTGQNEWRIGEIVIDPRQITVSSYVVVPGQDRIVPPESALPLARLLPHATLHEPMTGHVGLMASRSAPQRVWAPLVKWLGERE